MDNRDKIAIVGIGEASTLAYEAIKAINPDANVIIVNEPVPIPVRNYHLPEAIELEAIEFYTEPNNRRTRRKKARLNKRKK